MLTISFGVYAQGMNAFDKQANVIGIREIILRTLMKSRGNLVLVETTVHHDNAEPGKMSSEQRDDPQPQLSAFMAIENQYVDLHQYRLARQPANMLHHRNVVP